LVKESKEKEAELAKKYRDRAKERREMNKESDGGTYLPEDVVSATPKPEPKPQQQMYNASGGFNMSIGDNAEHRRRQAIEESKYLGGDLEHTHLVKGLDYALLQKVKAELKTPGSKAAAGDEENGEERRRSGNNDKQYDEDDDEDEEEREAEHKAYSEAQVETKETGEGDDSDENSNVEKPMLHSDDKIKMSLKPRIMLKSTGAAMAEALNKSRAADSPFAFKK
jgi:hypothetical protein